MKPIWRKVWHRRVLSATVLSTVIRGMPDLTAGARSMLASSAPTKALNNLLISLLSTRGNCSTKNANAYDRRHCQCLHKLLDLSSDVCKDLKGISSG